MRAQGIASESFFIGEPEGANGDVRRAMISLGPLSARKYCTYSCPFCYVKEDFQRYMPAAPEAIVRWLSERRGQFNVVYVSGDTDSFSPPRTDLGIELLQQLAVIDVDILFTTRFAFAPEHLPALTAVADSQNARGRLFVGCSSILAMNRQELEPRPIPSAAERLTSLVLLSESGATPVLALRPLLPDLTPEDITELVGNLPSCVRHVVTGPYYAPNPQHTDQETTLLSFDIGKSRAFVHENPSGIATLERLTADSGVELHHGSAHLIEALRNHQGVSS